MKSNYGTKILVTESMGGDVILRVHDEGVFLTPKKARKLARKLNKYASRIDIATRETFDVSPLGTSPFLNNGIGVRSHVTADLSPYRFDL